MTRQRSIFPLDVTRWASLPDRAAVRVAGALMKATYDAPARGSVLARALGTAAPRPNVLGTALMNRLAARLFSRLETEVEGEAAEEILEALLRLMQIVTAVDPHYRRNVVGFEGRYAFESLDGRVTVSAAFKDGWMHVAEGRIANPHLTLRFSTGRTLLQFLFTPNQDVLVAMLHNDVSPDGNLNYLYKLGYLAKRLQRMFSPR